MDDKTQTNDTNQTDRGSIEPFLKENKKEVPADDPTRTEPAHTLTWTRKDKLNAALQSNELVAETLAGISPESFTKSLAKIQEFIAGFYIFSENMSEIYALFPYLQKRLETVRKYRKLSLDEITLSDLRAAYTGDIDDSDKTMRLWKQAVSASKKELEADKQKLQDIIPYLEAVLRENPEYNELSLDKFILSDLLSAYRGDADKDNAALQLLTQAIKAALALPKNKPGNESSENPIEQYRGMPILKDNFYQNTTLANALVGTSKKGEIFGTGAVDLPVYNVGEPDEITIFVNAEINESSDLKITGKPYTQFDDAVQTAVVSLYKGYTGNGLPPLITGKRIAQEVYRTNGKLHQDQIDRVVESIEKQRFGLHVHADCTEQMLERSKNMRAQHKPGITIDDKPIEEIDGFQYIINDPMIIAANRLVKINGKVKNAYLLLPPPLLDYAAKTGQLRTVSNTALTVSEVNQDGTTGAALSLNDRKIAIKNYLIRRIESMKADEDKAKARLYNYEHDHKKKKDSQEKTLEHYRRMKRSILTETLYNTIEIPKGKERTAAKVFIVQCFEYWKAVGYIKNFSTKKKGKTIEAIQVEL